MPSTSRVALENTKNRQKKHKVLSGGRNTKRFFQMSLNLLMFALGYQQHLPHPSKHFPSLGLVSMKKEAA
ncbi:hypothetical protein CVS40_11610 [Lucilia cuprina]|nr:hypothetical protein CVS40_11610 [Lucilia cuprina]